MTRPEPAEGVRGRPILSRLAVLTLAAGACIAGPIHARAQATQAAPADTTHLAGKMVFAALVTPDLVAGERFYTDMFGWQFANAYRGQTLVGQASFGDRVVAAIVQKPMQEGQRPAWRSFFSSADVDATVQRATSDGATVLVSPHQIGSVGRDALMTDPQGAVFGILTESGADPADTLAAPGEWIWTSLATTDPETEAAFYKAVFGYDAVDLPGTQDVRHVILASQGFARASVNPMPADHPMSHARWIAYVRVADIQQSVANATTLGGHVLVAPHPDSHGGTIALLADPAGAVFGLLQWADDDTSTDGGEVSK